jgi:hypothetical protein
VRDHRLSSSPDSEVAVIAQERPEARISHPGVLGGRSAWPVVALWFLGVTVLSFLPYSAKVRLDTRGLLHTPAHVLVFAASVFIARPIGQQSARRWITCISIILYVVLIEIAQSWTNGSPFEWDDLIADIAGVGLALVAIWLYRARKTLPTIGG